MSDYLLQGGNGWYYFRMRIPNNLKQLFRKREFKKALRTKDYDRARLLAAACAMQATKEIEDKRRDLLMPKRQLTREDLLRTNLIRVNTTLGEIELDCDGDADKELELFEKFKEKHADLIVTQTPSAPVNAAAPEQQDIDLMVLFDKFAKAKLSKGIRPDTIDGYRTKLGLLIEMIGKTTARSVSVGDADRARELLTSWPKGQGKWRGKKTDEIIKAITAGKIPEKDRMSSKTADTYIAAWSSLFAWAQRRQRQYVSENPFHGTTFNTTKREKSTNKYQPFTHDDLRILFNDATFTQKAHNGRPMRYWLPLLALYTGARREEIANLHRKDIRQEEGVWVIDINTDHHNRVKNRNSHRLIPIHSHLITLGFLEYAKTRSSWLFPEESVDSKGRRANVWYNHIFSPMMKQLSIKRDGIKFHSFRTTVIREMMKKGGAEKEVFYCRVVGHTREKSDTVSTMTTEHYGDNAYAITDLQSAIELLDFREELKNVKPW